MRRIDPRAVAVEACITRHGTVIGPLMTDLIGHPELTPYRGGWCGNDIHPGGVVDRQPREGAGVHAPARRPARDRGLPRPARGRLPRRRRLRRPLPGRDQPAAERDQLDDERLGQRLRRHAAVPVSPGRVPRPRLRDRYRRPAPPLGLGPPDRHLGPDRPEGARRRDRAAARRAANGHLAAAGRRLDPVHARRPGLA